MILWLAERLSHNDLATSLHLVELTLIRHRTNEACVSSYCQDKREKQKEEYLKLEKAYKTVSLEREKMRQRLVKMKRRRNVDINQKICKNCQKEYVESENYLWSCRTHRSEYGGEMWWCCGKTNKDALGCKYNKHESKEDDDEEDAREKEEEKYKLKRIKCQCCKEVGHHTQDCYRDPNLITKRDTNEELHRLNKLREFRKLNLDTVEIPTRLMKKLAINAEENAFARGVLCFDDYNYKFHNA